MLKNKLIYVAAIAGTFWLMLMYNSFYLVVLMWMLIILPFALILLLGIWFFRIKVDMGISRESGTKHTPIPVQIKIDNESSFPVAYAEIKISYQNRFANERNVEIIATPVIQGQAGYITFTVIPSYCGILDLKLISIRYFDYLKLFSIRKKLYIHRKILVMPRIISFETEIHPKVDNRQSDTEHFSKIKPGDDSSEVFDIREYKAGDKLQRIHWKLSSKKDILMVKEFSLPIDDSLVLLLDLCVPEGVKNKAAYTDTLLETLFSISASLIENDCTHSIVWHNSQTGEIARRNILSENDLYDIMLEVLSVPVYNKPLAIVRYNEEFGYASYAHMMYVTTDYSIETIEEINEYHESDATTIFVVGEFATTGFPEETEELLREKGMRAIPVLVGETEASIDFLSV